MRQTVRVGFPSFRASQSWAGFMRVTLQIFTCRRSSPGRQGAQSGAHHTGHFQNFPLAWRLPEGDTVGLF